MAASKALLDAARHLQAFREQQDRLAARRARPAPWPAPSAGRTSRARAARRRSPPASACIRRIVSRNCGSALSEAIVLRSFALSSVSPALAKCGVAGPLAARAGQHRRVFLEHRRRGASDRCGQSRDVAGEVPAACAGAGRARTPRSGASAGSGAVQVVQRGLRSQLSRVLAEMVEDQRDQRDAAQRIRLLAPVGGTACSALAALPALAAAPSRLRPGGTHAPHAPRRPRAR